jgi:hypothetical protein
MEIMEQAFLKSSTSGGQAQESSKRTGVLKKKKLTKEASVQTSITTTVPTPALRRSSHNVPVSISREDSTQTD